MASETVENYLKAIYTLSGEARERGGDPQAAVGRLAAILGVTAGTVTSMVKKLTAAKLCRAERYGGVSLTARGERAALGVLRRHRLIETFLVETLKLDWSEVHDEAERLEHAVSDRLLERIDEFLGRPGVDPHGDPIPDRDGTVRPPRLHCLRGCKAGSMVRIARITDQDGAFLKFIDRHGLRPGARVTVHGVDAQAEAITLHPVRHPPVSLSLAAAAKVMVEMVEGR